MNAVSFGASRAGVAELEPRRAHGGPHLTKGKDRASPGETGGNIIGAFRRAFGALGVGRRRKGETAELCLWVDVEAEFVGVPESEPVRVIEVSALSAGGQSFWSDTLRPGAGGTLTAYVPRWREDAVLRVRGVCGPDLACTVWVQGGCAVEAPCFKGAGPTDPAEFTSALEIQAEVEVLGTRRKFRVRMREVRFDGGGSRQNGDGR